MHEYSWADIPCQKCFSSCLLGLGELKKITEVKVQLPVAKTGAGEKGKRLI